MAAALTIPIGMVAASVAHAGNGHTANCTGTSGALDNVLTNNGVGDNGGLLLQLKGPQQYKLSATGQTCTGGDVSAGRVKAVITTATAVNCQTVQDSDNNAGNGKTPVPLGGSGTFTWTAPAGMGTSNFNIRFTWTSPTTLHFAGSVSAGGSSSNVFGGNHITGNVTTTQSLKSKASGGDCLAVVPLSHFAITAISYSIS